MVHIVHRTGDSRQGGYRAGTYDAARSFDHPNQMRTYFESLRSAGITLSLNVTQTLRHISFPLAMEKDFPFHRRESTSGHSDMGREQFATIFQNHVHALPGKIK
jgi:hypothetical protein